jgi:hypothetical protein
MRERADHFATLTATPPSVLYPAEEQVFTHCADILPLSAELGVDVPAELRRFYLGHPVMVALGHGPGAVGRRPGRPQPAPPDTRGAAHRGLMTCCPQQNPTRQGEIRSPSRSPLVSQPGAPTVPAPRSAPGLAVKTSRILRLQDASDVLVIACALPQLAAWALPDQPPPGQQGEDDPQAQQDADIH